MTEYDIPWKQVLDAYLKGFLELCLPHVHDGIDWNSPIENHEQELPQLFPNSPTAGRVADKLFRAKFAGRDPAHLVHDSCGSSGVEKSGFCQAHFYLLLSHPRSIAARTSI